MLGPQGAGRRAVGTEDSCVFLSPRQRGDGAQSTGRDGGSALLKSAGDKILGPLGLDVALSSSEHQTDNTVLPPVPSKPGTPILAGPRSGRSLVTQGSWEMAQFTHPHHPTASHQFSDIETSVV